MIILEGPDNAGKSTLAKKLTKDLNACLNLPWDVTTVHAGGPGFSPDKMLDSISYLKMSCVLDRASFISEPVYATAVGRDTSADFHACQAMTNSLLVHKGCYLVYVTGELNRLLNFENHEVKSHETEEHVLAVKDNARKIIAYYNYFMAPFGGYRNFTPYDYVTDSYTRLLESCIAYILERTDAH